MLMKKNYVTEILVKRSEIKDTMNGLQLLSSRIWKIYELGNLLLMLLKLITDQNIFMDIIFGRNIDMMYIDYEEMKW